MLGYKRQAQATALSTDLTRLTRVYLNASNVACRSLPIDRNKKRHPAVKEAGRVQAGR